MDLILASSSPRRQDLLEEAGIHFRVLAAAVDEWDASSHPELTPTDLVRANARRKAEAVAMDRTQDVILAADTVVCCRGRILGKPRDEEEAFHMLEWLAGKTRPILRPQSG